MACCLCINKNVRSKEYYKKHAYENITKMCTDITSSIKTAPVIIDVVNMNLLQYTVSPLIAFQ